MAWHDGRRAERAHTIQRASEPDTEPIGTNGVPPTKTRSPVNKTERSGIQATTSLVVCAGRADVVQLDTQIVDPHGQTVLERDERRQQDADRPNRSLSRYPAGGGKGNAEDLFATQRVADDGRQRQQAVAMRVVAVVMGVDQRANRFVGYARDRLK